ncbi:FkbM family methyltransferase [Dactylosporangium matsuzakiense]|uniref:Methyltransferase FkbM domain-containing protein n=1 Tax=Dactylosporangium matsuzakiense TaxID=53360 RepID=A0A9W6KWG9_9ACTN|nr:FkbM family methyltransferase [Dactylosporangium matsuzakiense]UWZ41205.1 FkbM family methyltransferase [Dactylosporangium matsuzakiense]GLL08512.1 hypothetical protein GCM10017581_102790 [Dactylosporangium matsuzakiense]
MPTIDFVQLEPDFGCYGVNTPGAIIELRAIHQETFVDHTYLQHGVTVPPGGTVLDIGANVGLFSLALKRTCPSARIHAFEPAPAALEALRANLALHGAAGVTVHAVGLGAVDDPGVPFTFYPNIPGNSTRYPELKEFDRARISADWGTSVGDSLYGGQTVEVPLQRLSTVLAQHPEVTTIDLAKIDVEGAELEVLGGIDEADWPRLHRIVVEVQDLDGRAEAVQDLLTAHGFELNVETPEALAHLNYRTVYAVRPEVTTTGG